MFTFHKSDTLPQHRHLSADSPVILPSPSASTSDLSTPGSDGSSYGAMYSPEQKHKAQFSKRSSVFNLRSRSNTATSVASSIMTAGSPDMAYYDSSRPQSPHPLSQYSNPNLADSAGSRKMFSRGKKGKRLSESVTPGIDSTEMKEKSTSEKRASILSRGRRRNNQSDISLHSIKHSISSPFDFQHLTHTDRHHFASMEQSSEDTLAAGFRAVRASQQPSKGLTGIRAQDLDTRNLSSENLLLPSYRPGSALRLASPPESPSGMEEWQQEQGDPQDHSSRPHLRLTRSVESFSQPGVSLRNHRATQSVVAPPRLSSLLPSIDDIAEDANEEVGAPTSGRSRSKRESGIWDSFSHITSPAASPLKDDTGYFGHAVTTPDDTAIQAMTPPLFSPSLADVAEEPERFVRPRRAPQPPADGPTTPRSPHFDTSIFSHQHSPAVSPRDRAYSHTSPHSRVQRKPDSRPLSQMSETLGSMGVVRKCSVRRPSAVRRQSNTWRVLEDSWEDDVDYIYEHALEADCDFEWDRPSDEERYKTAHATFMESINQPIPGAPQTAPVTSSTAQVELRPQPEHSSSDFRASLLVPITSGVPDLEPTSATTASTLETRLLTPSESFSQSYMLNPEGFMLSPSLLIPREYKETHEDSYEDLLNEYNGSERHFTMIDPRYSTTSSARSSRARFSRRSSYDSSLMSSAQSSGLWSSPVRRSASSAGSVPDLVPSRRTRPEFSFSVMMDHLSDSVVSLQEDKDNDSDITPPGGILGNTTPAPAKGDTADREDRQSVIRDELRASLELARQGAHQEKHSSIDHELKASLDLARQGSQRSKYGPARHHKQANSDGAAKLLANAPRAQDNLPTKSRARAATTSQNIRQPMLSLFPAPPRRSPIPN